MLCREHKFDRVCHLAAQAGVRYSIQNPAAYQKANLEGHLNILEACRHAKIPRLVYASSSSVYGGNKKIPFNETDPVDNPVSLYAATKKADELMSHTYTHLYGLQTVGLRFFTVYGPWGRPDMAYWTFTEAMLKGKPIPVFNHGKMERDFTYITDIVAGVKAALFADGLEPYEIFNLGNSKPENLMDFIRTLAGALGVEPKMEMLPMQPGDVPVTFADVSKARKKLGYDPSTPISKGLPEFVKWYKEYFNH
jgi:UDP-glucuronate 4-epimerase